MNTNCCQCSVPHHGSFKAFGPAAQAWHERLTTGLSRSLQASDHILEHLEEEMLHQTRDVQRRILEAAQTRPIKHPRPVRCVAGS